MTAIRTTLYLALTAIALSCGGAKSGPKPPTPNKVDVEIAAVTLGEDCGMPPTAHADEPAREDRISSEADESQMRICRQTSVQLRIANGTTTPAKIVIRKIELLDEAGALVGELTPRAPSRWTDNLYMDWDEHVAPGDTIEASYALSDPAVTAGKTYIVRLTVDAGDGERTLEERGKLQAEAEMPPDFET